MAKVKPKMIYASSKEELKKRLVGLACEIQGSDQGDIEFKEVFFFFLVLALFSYLNALLDPCPICAGVRLQYMQQTCRYIWSALVRVVVEYSSFGCHLSALVLVKPVLQYQ